MGGARRQEAVKEVDGLCEDDGHANSKRVERKLSVLKRQLIWKRHRWKVTSQAEHTKRSLWRLFDSN